MNEEQQQKINADWVNYYVERATDRGVPYMTARQIAEYVVIRRHPGDFVRNVITNDLKGAFTRADCQNEVKLPSIVRFMYNVAPVFCWGSQNDFDNWLNGKFVDEMPWANGTAAPFGDKDDLTQLRDDERSEHDFAPGGPGTA